MKKKFENSLNEAAEINLMSLVITKLSHRDLSIWAKFNFQSTFCALAIIWRLDDDEWQAEEIIIIKFCACVQLCIFVMCFNRDSR